MEALDALRNAVKEAASRSVGRDSKQPHQFQGQMAASDFLSLIMALPVDAEDWTALQDATTGELVYVLGGDLLGGDVPLGG